MGFELRREIRDLLPSGGVLTDKECRLILELADNANETTRRAWPGVDWLADVCDIPNAKRVGEFLTSIARKWVELRVEIGKDKNGKPYYAKSGQRTAYRLPTRSELAELLGESEVPPTPGLSPRKDPATAGPQVPVKEGAEPPAKGGPQVPAKGGPYPSGVPQRTPQTTLTSPYPITPGADLDVVDAEIVEEAEEAAASPEDQLQKLTDEVRAIRPNWRAVDIRTQISAAIAQLGDMEAVTVLVLNTAKDTDTAKPSRITASGNPHLKQVSLALMVARADAMPDTRPPEPVHPGAHPFQPKTHGSKVCGWNDCELPEANSRHRVGNQGGGYIAQTAAGRVDRDERAGQLVSPGGSVRPGGTYLRLTDSRASGRDYTEDF